MLVVVAGGAGFLGASLVDRLQAEGDEVVVVDDLSHGHLANLAEARRRGGVRFHRMDVAQGGLATLADRVRADAWVHLATGPRGGGGPPPPARGPPGAAPPPPPTGSGPTPGSTWPPRSTRSGPGRTRRGRQGR